MGKEELIKSLEYKGFSPKTIKMFKSVSREDFVLEKFHQLAYEDIALPLSKGSTISQPTTIAFMLDLLDLKENHKVLEIGSGSGYVLALISTFVKGKIYGMEINKELVNFSRKRLDKRIKIIEENGKDGLPTYAPFDRIIISASYQKIPFYLIDQLSKDGIIVVPVKGSIYKIYKNKHIIEYPDFIFVPLRY